MDLFKLFGTIVVENKEAIAVLSETADEAESTGKSADKIGEGFQKNGEAAKSKLVEIAKISGKTTDEVESEAKKLAQSYEEAGDDSATAMRKAYADIESAAKKASDGSKKSGADMKKIFGMVTTAGAAVVSTIVAIGNAMIDLANSTREYRIEMAKLETAFLTAGYSADAATTTYQTLYSVLGETDQAVEAANMLARLCDNEEELAKMTKACIGVYATFGNSLPVEGLAEAANETAKVGTVTGQLADALNWLGISEDDFNEKLSKCNTERERAAIITSTMVEAYEGAAESYQENNEAITEVFLAQERLNAAIARWGEVCEPAAIKWTNFKAALTEGASDFFSGAWLVRFQTASEELAQYTTIEEITDRLEILRSKLEELNDIPFNKRDFAYSATVDKVTAEIKNLEQAYHELVSAEQKASDEAVASLYAIVDTSAEFSSITEQYVADAISLFEQFGATYEGIANKVAGWFAPFEKASVSVTTSVTAMMNAMQSQIDFNNAYSENLQKLKDYGLGELSEAFQSYGANGAAYAQALVDAVEKAGGATTEKGQEIINGFSEMNQQVTESQKELTDTIALLDGEMEAAVKEFADTYGIAIEDLNKSAEAKNAAKTTFEAFLTEMNAQIPGILDTITSFGEQITSALKNGVSGISFTITPSFDPSFTPIPEHETGLDYVPYDNYLAYLHQGEAVLTAKEANAWRAGKEMASGGDSGNGGVTVNQYIEAVAQTPVELASATAAYFEQARWTL